MYMKKNYFIFAAALMALASCQTDDYLGNNPGNAEGTTEGAIRFDGGTGKITRATSNTGKDAAAMLGHQFKIYGVKAKSSTDGNTTYEDVFKDYMLWDETANSTTSNTNGWEYVGEAGKHGTDGSQVDLKTKQTIKYWDYSSSEYHFVAGAPEYAIKFNLKQGTNEIESATISKGLKGHITANNWEASETTFKAADDPAPVYIAEPVIARKTRDNGSDYQKPVKFNFVRQQSKVRVGVYETIPGYSISEIHFYSYEKQNSTEGQGETTEENDYKASTSNNIILTSTGKGYFQGGDAVEGTINYTWTGDGAPSYSLSYTSNNNLTTSKNWYGGELKKGVEATSSTESTKSKLYGVDKDMEATGYFTVLPTVATKVSPIMIKCDYTLKSDDNSGETIKVTGATAAIPAAFSKWETNTQYTYLFKISQNTNGTTGKPGESGQPGDPAGLFPITFDAAVAEVKDGTSQGTITSVTTPSITTKQEGSVTADGIEYKAGKPITVNVTESTKGTDLDLKDTQAKVGYIAVYKYTTSITEAELQLKAPTGTPETSTISDKTLSFTPSAEGYYVIQYLTTAATSGENAKPAVYTYKVVYVNKADTNQPTVSSGE